MKAFKFFLSLLISLSTSMLWIGCGNTSDMPAYALGKGSYFSNPDPGFRAVSGKITTLSEEKSFGYDEYNRLAKVKGYETEFDGQKFYMVFVEKHWGYDSTYRLFEDESLSMHALVTRNTDKKYRMDEECDYSDTYYFVNDKELAKAIEVCKAASTTKNYPSKYKVEDYRERGEVKTYHANIVAVAEYRGKRLGEDDRFLSIYLSCGAVVQLYTDKEIGYSYSDDLTYRMDCVVDGNNKVITYEID